MQYDPIKRSLGKVFTHSPWLRKLFYRMLDILLLRAWHIKRELRRWAATAPRNANILDAGSGFGQYVFALSRISLDFNIKGVEIKTEQIDDCNQFFEQIGENHRIAFEYADLTQFSESQAYHLILSVDVMEHIAEDVTVFKNFHQALQPGGMLLISTPSDQGGSDVHDHGEASFIDEHVRDGYNISDIEEKLYVAGFQKVETRYSYGIPGKISWRLSMKYPILMLNTSRLFFLILPFYYLITMPFCLFFNYLDVRMHHATGTGLIVRAFK
jgi:SAM-dependent methyltransferase